jgi:protein SCO1/2/putative membrane protein
VTRTTLFLFWLCLAGCSAANHPSTKNDSLYPVPDFSLTERTGKPIHKSDLTGKVWVAAFIFTRCSGPCTQVSGTMARLQQDLAGSKDVVLVSFSVDPEYDTPKVLSEYAKKFGADPERWLFVTGKPKQVYGLIREGFRLTARPNEGADRTPGNEIMHDTRLAVVDRRGAIRGYYQATEPEAIGELEKKVASLLWEKPSAASNAGQEPSFGAEDLPSLNALLNAICASLLVVGYTSIRGGFVRLHQTCMLTALAVSALFLTSYLYYHFAIRGGQPTYFSAQGWPRYVYFAVLTTHTLLAAVVAPMALITAYLGLRNRLDQHMALARWTLPIWLYVSITGVVVYVMLYRLYPPL